MPDPDVSDWSEIAAEFGDSVLVGNGLSRRFSNSFAYNSLYEEASGSSHHGRSLSTQDTAIFEAFRTHDFEAVLASLVQARLVLAALGQDTSLIDARYESIRDSLAGAVNRIHPEQGFMGPMFDRLRDAIAGFSLIFTTNYDLILYWAIMHNTQGFNDYFRAEPCWESGEWVCFSRPGARSLESSSNILYLHGALHLGQTMWGQTIKLRSSLTAGRLLERFSALSTDTGPISPLFVSEGSAEQKLAAIGRSDYLSFAYERFAEPPQSLCIFGHALGTSDHHIIDAIAKWEPLPIGISVRTGANVRQLWHRISALFPQHEVKLYWASSHPIADLGFPMFRPLHGTWPDQMDLP